MTAHSRTSKLSVPLHRIPKVHALCVKCGSSTKALFGTAQAAGYHRRHRCIDIHCDATFYTLADYRDGTVKTSPLPFKDRVLADFELAERDAWWAEAAVIVCSEDTAMLNRLDSQARIAFGTPEQSRTKRQAILVKYLTELNKTLERIEAQPGETNG